MISAGRMVGEFVLEEKIGEGGGGAVFRAFQPMLQRHAVVKTRQAEGEGRVERFLQEARLASRLEHPYAAHVYAFGVENDGLMWLPRWSSCAAPSSAASSSSARWSAGSRSCSDSARSFKPRIQSASFTVTSSRLT